MLFKKILSYLQKSARFFLGLGIFILVAVLVLFLRLLFLAFNAPCTSCLDLTTWLNQTLTLLAPALASLTSGIFLKKKEEKQAKY